MDILRFPELTHKVADITGLTHQEVASVLRAVRLLAEKQILVGKCITLIPGVQLKPVHREEQIKRVADGRHVRIPEHYFARASVSTFNKDINKLQYDFKSCEEVTDERESEATDEKEN